MKAILTTMKLAVPAAFVLLLAGCITDPYQYRGGGYGGDYYHGRPSVDVRHHGGYYGYGDPYYGRSGWSFGLRYGYPYGYDRYGYGGYHGYGRYPYYGGYPYYRTWPAYPPIVVRPRPGTDPGSNPDPGSDSEGQVPWRDLARLRDRNPGPYQVNSEPQEPRIRGDYRERIPEPQSIRAPRPMASQAPARSTSSNRSGSSNRTQRVQRMIEERDNEP